LKRTWINILKAGAILLGGIVVLSLFWFAYLGITILLEATIFHENPQDLPQGSLRNLLVLLVCVLIIFLMNTKLYDTIKGMLLLSGISVFIIAIVLHFYTIIWLAVILTVLLSGIIIWILIKKHKPWFYYLALGMGVFIALLYAWPK